tara:strand:- start:16223 stop:17224 length:1002 start_codon:yes stop_codon:yes gene_type:complete
MKKITLIIFFFSIINAYSQYEEHIPSLVEAYFSPLSESVSNGINNGWYNTAKPHGILGFDLSFSLNMIHIPEEALSYNPNDLENYTSNTTSLPNIFSRGLGEILSQTEQVQYQGPNNSISTLNIANEKYFSPKILPIPVLNGGFGIGKKTSINFRYLPEKTISISNLDSRIGLSTSLWGAGIKHDLLQYLPAGNLIPLGLSIQGAHTSISNKINSPAEEFNLNINTSTINLIASKSFILFTAMASIGFNSTKSEVINYPNVLSYVLFGFPATLYEDGSFNNGDFNYYDIKFDRVTEFRQNIGVKFNIAIVSIHLNHTFSKYPVTTIGAGVSIN